MQFGPVIPQSTLGSDAGALREYAQAVQDLGYDFLVSSDHAVGSTPEAHPELDRVFSVESLVNEPLTLFAFLAGAAPRLGFLSSVVILPQRQAVLAAKQAAQVDLACGGRFRFGVGIGWNPVEFEALNEDFHNRARRFEEQIKVMRLLWTETTATFKGRYHTLSTVGINPRPIQRPIPIWVGASADASVRRACRIADGYLPLRPLEGGWDATIEKVHGWLQEAGRDPSSFGIEGRLDTSSGTPDDWSKTVQMWRRFGASHLSISTGGLSSADAHIDRVRQLVPLLRDS